MVDHREDERGDKTLLAQRLQSIKEGAKKRLS